jgi:hypothetical protein
MKYKLAKELKDAGFPQTNNHTRKYLAITGTPYFSSRPERAEDVLAPTLEELIEACDESFIELRRHAQKTTWSAMGRSGKDTFQDGTGATPVEAVTRLWLALNKQNADSAQSS